ncbi:hypothetical protein BDE02_05G086000 [Populus trichocarpa]|nr:hypothetical protein BDE02_05G086000 [Populus trichocarpa]
MMATAPGKCFLVTGPPGVGKTTLIMRVFETLKTSNPTLKIQGFYTREIREGIERVGFEVVTLDGRKAPLASTTISTVFSCFLNFFLTVATELCPMYKVDVVISFDLELLSLYRYLPARFCIVARLRDHPGAKIFTLSPSNRDAVKEQIYTQLVDSE